MNLIWHLISIFMTVVKHTKRRRCPCLPSSHGLSIIRNLHQLGELPHQFLLKLSKKFGPVMLLKSTVIIVSPETEKQVLRDHDLHWCSSPSLVLDCLQKVI
ncbi:hypothetical protein IGI04_025930 [Brassica rapa subsp. trilocularis]|uniref:Uncharacterized protein n=1 Tax=Brassica rapa subsp. trilocularis TaxID=1813537 RepID=A0ABQ7KYD9_BRACM|nr:hypothetical protein IGI04_025930 [Brassica rapa subsp. trilocularis]